MLLRRLLLVAVCLTILIAVGAALAQVPLVTPHAGASIQAPFQAQSTTQIVYVTRTGEKYHR